MNVYTFSEAKQNLASLLEQASLKGAVKIKRRDGQSFIITPEKLKGSPLDVEGVHLNLSKEEIIQFIGEDRRENSL